jgi:tetratricopeptide (TPR) repeat protein
MQYAHVIRGLAPRRLVQMVQVLRERDLPEKALKLVDLVLRMSAPPDGDALRRQRLLRTRALILQDLNRPAEAVVDFEAAIQLELGEPHPSAAFVMNVTGDKALALFESGELREALELGKPRFESAIGRYGFGSETSMRAALWMGECLVRLDSPEQALTMLAHFDQAGLSVPGDLMQHALSIRADAYRDLGDFAEAGRLYVLSAASGGESRPELELRLLMAASRALSESEDTQTLSLLGRIRADYAQFIDLDTECEIRGAEADAHRATGDAELATMLAQELIAFVAERERELTADMAFLHRATASAVIAQSRGDSEAAEFGLLVLRRLATEGREDVLVQHVAKFASRTGLAQSALEGVLL